MVEIFEVIMLLCFGFSWPISLYNHVKAKTAKTMNLKFIILIIVGYIAGIISKIISGRYIEPMHIFVLIVYLINLVVVSLNLVVYFVNRNKDNAKLKINE